LAAALPCQPLIKEKHNMHFPGLAFINPGHFTNKTRQTGAFIDQGSCFSIPIVVNYSK
jgi:hypothetical protein